MMKKINRNRLQIGYLFVGIVVSIYLIWGIEKDPSWEFVIVFMLVCGYGYLDDWNSDVSKREERERYGTKEEWDRYEEYVKHIDTYPPVEHPRLRVEREQEEEMLRRLDEKYGKRNAGE